MQTRYYDPEVGRFISQDSLEFADPESINGLNLYAYCGNNPVMNVDPTGTVDWGAVGRVIGGFLLSLVGMGIATAGIIPALVSPAATVVSEFGLTLGFYGAALVVSAFDSAVYSDMELIGWNPYNNDANAATKSKIISFYNGVPIIRTTGKRSGTLGIMLLSSANADTVKHEFGHIPQLVSVGLWKFLLYIGIPSAAKLGHWAHTSNKYDYYNAPWETMADMFGGVIGWNNNVHTSGEKAQAILHLLTVKFFGIFSLLFAL